MATQLNMRIAAWEILRPILTEKLKAAGISDAKILELFAPSTKANIIDGAARKAGLDKCTIPTNLPAGDKYMMEHITLAILGAVHADSDGDAEAVKKCAEKLGIFEAFVKAARV